MNSMDSIGTCSLDSNSDNVSVTNNAHRSISERTLKSNSLEENPNINTKMSSKSSSLHMLKNGHRLPSYVGLSCAISGYTNYSRYCTSLRNNTTGNSTDNTIDNTTDNSPTLNTVTHHSTQSNNNNIVYSEQPVNYDMIKNEHDGDYDSLKYDSLNSTLSETDTQLQTYVMTDDVNNSRKSHSSSDGPSAVNKQSKCDDVRSDSLVQKRIAALYGEKFAAGWRESRTKYKYKQYQQFTKNSTAITKGDKLRSPSCPPERNHANDIHSNQRTKSPPVFRHITKVFLEQLETADENAPIDDHSSSMKSVKAEVHSVPSKYSDSSLNAHIHNKTPPVKDGNWFLTELNQTTAEIREKVNHTEKILSEHCEVMGDDSAGKLRAAIGKANLLMTQKFNQFKDLCVKNINQHPDEQYRTTNEDLEGFWDMMTIQVMDVNETFAEIIELQKREWKPKDEELKPKIISPIKSRSRKTYTPSPKGSPSKSNSDKSNSDDSSMSRDVERRNRLKEAKRRAKLMAAKNVDNNITIFTPTNSSND